LKVTIVIFTLFLISCNSSGQKTDIDTVPDKDSAVEPDVMFHIA